MRHSTIYRMCLLAVVILTIAGGIFYYVNYVERQTTVMEGTLVRSGNALKKERENYRESTVESGGVAWQERQYT